MLQLPMQIKSNYIFITIVQLVQPALSSCGSGGWMWLYTLRLLSLIDSAQFAVAHAKKSPAYLICNILNDH